MVPHANLLNPQIMKNNSLLRYFLFPFSLLVIQPSIKAQNSEEPEIELHVSYSTHEHEIEFVNMNLDQIKQTQSTSGTTFRIQLNRPSSKSGMNLKYFILFSEASSITYDFEDRIEEKFFFLGPGMILEYSFYEIGFGLFYLNYMENDEATHLPATSFRARAGNPDNFYAVLGMRDYTLPIAQSDMVNIEAHKSFGDKLKLDAGVYFGFRPNRDELMFPGGSLEIKHRNFGLKVLYRHIEAPIKSITPSTKLVYSLSVAF